ncbi:MAG: hypothetical protein WC783_03270, partial [Candidatus Paceibacterota bacterium]
MKEIKAKYDKYISLIKEAQDNHGFIESQKCDSLIFTSLVGCLPEVNVDIKAAFDSKTGTWQRRPIERPCYPAHSKSTISRDQLLGLAWYTFYNKKLDISEQIVKYAINHAGYMGKGSLSRINIRPSLLATYAC